jgi:hypothetical protein
MKHKGRFLTKKAVISYSQISILIVAVFAFCFIIWEGERGNAIDPSNPELLERGWVSVKDPNWGGGGYIKSPTGTSHSFSQLSGRTLSADGQSLIIDNPANVDPALGTDAFRAMDTRSISYTGTGNPPALDYNPYSATPSVSGPAPAGADASRLVISANPISNPAVVKEASLAGKYSFNGVEANKLFWNTETKGVYIQGANGQPVIVGNSQTGEGMTFLRTPEYASGTTPIDPSKIMFYDAPSKYGSAASQWWAEQFPGTWWGAGGAVDALISGLQWAALAYIAGYMIGSLAGWDKDKTQAFSTALAAGSFLGKWVYVQKTLFGLGKTSIFTGEWIYSGLLGLSVAYLVYSYMMKETEQQVVEFQCLPWQAPRGGEDCEKCNKDKLNPCSEYRCKSLGQLCELENKGTDKEMCIAVDLRETDPPVIKPNEAQLTQGYRYTNVKTSPPSPGFEIKPNSGECIKAFTPIKFGISTYHPNGETTPSRCKIDIKHTKSFDEMAYWMGGSNLYDFNHTDFFSLPGPKALANSSLILENGKTMTFYIRCEGKNDKPNVNPAEYMLKFCIDPSPDGTAPEIKATSLLTDSCIPENKNNAIVEFYTNEPAECRWSYQQSRSFDEMENTMICPTRVQQINDLMLYTCVANLTGVKRSNTEFFIKCRDQPELKGKNDSQRNTMQSPYKFVLKNSEGLKITKMGPNGTVYWGASPAFINLYAETSGGCNDGKARCYFSQTNNNDYIEFFETNTADGINQQPIYATSGTQLYYIKCVDGGGNVALNTTSVNVEILTGGPVVARAYVTDSSKLKISTLRKSECSYSFDNCDFSFSQGFAMLGGNETVHYADLKMDKTYYIRCRDEFAMDSSGCSIILKPQQLMQSVSE